jgi:RimJ/RimL family protein N-acetyltransferase
MVMIYTGVLDYNLASVKVLMKNGFSVDGFRKKVFLMDDGFHSFFYLSRILD